MNTSIKPELDKFLSWGFASLAVILMLASFPHITTHTEAQQQLQNQQAAVVQALPTNYFASTTIQAQAAYVIDLKDNKVLYEKNANASLPLASLTKVMTAYTALKQASSTAIITINPESLAQEGDSGLYSYEQWKLRDLLSYSLVISSNDGAQAIAQNIGAQLNASTSDSTTTDANVQTFVSLMNTNAKSLGLTQTRFYNPTGLDNSSTQAGAYGSAKDVAKLLAFTSDSYPSVFIPTTKASITSTSETGFVHTAPNTNSLTTKIIGMTAGKTGYTELAGGNLAIVTTVSNRPVAIVVLGSTYSGRFDDVMSLLTTAKKTLQN